MSRPFTCARRVLPLCRMFLRVPCEPAVSLTRSCVDSPGTHTQPAAMQPVSTPLCCSLEFSVGDNEVHDFCMIERHYFHDRLIKSYDFDFGFCIPNTTNTWDATYGMPPLDPELGTSTSAAVHVAPLHVPF